MVGQDPNNCGESMLDVEYMMAVAQQAPTTYWSTPDTEDFSQWLIDVSAAPNPPLVHSVSYVRGTRCIQNTKFY